MNLFIKSLIPPIFITWYRVITKKNITFTGKFYSWDEAKKYSDGYQTKEIFNKVKDATLKVKNGEACFERDSVIYDKPQYSSSIMSILMLIAANNNGLLRVLDFGGSLGSIYFQNKHLLSELNLEWSIVEQSHFVEYGKKELSDNTLQFYMDIEECLSERKLDVIMISNTLQYLENPYQWLNCFINSKIDYIFVDTATFSRNQDEYITIQKVPNHIYKASYPLHILDQRNVMNLFLQSGYKLSHRIPVTNDAETKDFFFESLLFKKLDVD